MPKEIKQYGLIGFPLSHSFSPSYFKAKFEREKIANCHYDLFPLKKIEDFSALLEVQKNLSGLNVTIPYKEEIIPYLDEMDEIAKSVGAVNTIQFENGKLKGYNTDVIGFQESLSGIVQDFHTKALILGTGGAAKAIAYALDQMNIRYIFISRHPNNENEISYEYLTEKVLNKFLLIINTTPLGMSPDINISPLQNTQLLSKNHLVFDLIYNPEKTLLLQQAAQQGANIKNGQEMLELQAEASWDIWNTDK